MLLALSYDYVGDLAETVALIWPARDGANAPPPALAEVVEALELDAEIRAAGADRAAGWTRSTPAAGWH